MLKEVVEGLVMCQDVRMEVASWKGHLDRIADSEGSVASEQQQLAVLIVAAADDDMRRYSQDRTNMVDAG